MHPRTVSRKIIELHHGELVLDNRPGGGASAKVYLPMSGITPAS